MSEAADLLAPAAVEAVRVARELVLDPSAPPAVRLAACRLVLEQSAQRVSVADLQAQLAAVLALLEDDGDDGGGGEPTCAPAPALSLVRGHS